MGTSILLAVLGLFCVIMLATHLALCIGINRCRKRELQWRYSGEVPYKLVSIIIPARNEEQNLPALFTSLPLLQSREIEIILVDDRSTDTTRTLMNRFVDESVVPVTVVGLSENPQTGNPKQFALLKGIEAASGDLLLFTDADCVVQPNWVEAMCRPFGDENVGVTFGPVHTISAPLFRDQYQTFDHVFRFFYNVGSAGIGSATGIYGNNMAIRSSLIADIGGYGALGYSVTEDNALLSLVRHKTSYTVAALSLPDVKVEAQPQKTWRELTAQELRWSTGAFFSPDPMTRFGYSLVKLYLAGGFIGLIFAPLFPLSLMVTVSTVVSMSSIAITGGMMLRMPPRFWFMFLPNILWSMVYYLFVDLLSFLRVPIRWKGNRLKKM